MRYTLVTGVDLVYVPRFKRAIKKGGHAFLRRIFHESELENYEVAHLAGVFAAKEAVIKALSLPVDSWQGILVTKLPTGAPHIQITNYQLPITNYSVSISHDGNYVIAQFVGILEDDATN